jgi:hypothetical protein
VAPPSLGRASYKVTEQPVSPSAIAAEMPASPPPTIATGGAEALLIAPLR